MAQPLMMAQPELNTTPNSNLNDSIPDKQIWIVSTCVGSHLSFWPLSNWDYPKNVRKNNFVVKITCFKQILISQFRDSHLWIFFAKYILNQVKVMTKESFHDLKDTKIPAIFP